MLRAAIARKRPALMGVLNCTPDSFSDGGRYDSVERAVARGLEMAREGADILDLGGESTRPGADYVAAAEEIRRVIPVIEGLRKAGCEAPISIDTRKAAVAEAALEAGARIFNDVSALTHDPASPAIAARYAEAGGMICLMHAQGDPKTMQDNPHYDDVVAEVRAYLENRAAFCESLGAPREALILDPGIGFGKTLAHNLALIRHFDRFADRGCLSLLGASRKRFIGTLGGVEKAEARAPGSIAAAIEGARRGASIIRAHDVAQTRQALAVWRAIEGEA